MTTSRLLDYVEGVQPADIVTHFRERFGVVVKVEGDLYQFKYHMIEAKWDRPVTHECRGAILRKGDSWKIVSRPFDKFFNLNEGRCPVFDRGELEGRIGDCHLTEKADGTCIQLWWDEDQARWRASTLGTITTSNVQDEDLSFEDLFFRVSNIDPRGAPLERGTTYLFELCSTLNRVVTRYAVDQVVLLGARLNDTGAAWGLDALRAVRDTLCDAGCFVRMIRISSVLSLGITTEAHLLEYVEAESRRGRQGEEYPEGFVLYGPDNAPLAKIKNQRYLVLHGTNGSDMACSRNRITDAVFLGFLDDIYEALPDRLKVFADSVVAKAKDLGAQAHSVHTHLCGRTFENRKEVALAIQQDDIPGDIRGFFFQNIARYLDKTKETETYFASSWDLWLTKNYTKFDWKTVDSRP